MLGKKNIKKMLWVNLPEKKIILFNKKKRKEIELITTFLFIKK
jgi:hypothetical protein